jgi:hypothetical protein
VAVLGAGALTASVPQLRERFARTAMAWMGERGVDEALGARGSGKPPPA